VPYSGKVAIDGVNFQGSANFAFEISDAQGTVHWRNGATPNVTISVSVTNGRYVVQLGGQGMNPLAPDLFLAHDELYLKVRFDPGDGQGLRLLGPDQRITATPYALAADLARLAQGVPPGSITREMLASSVLSDLNNSGSGNSSFQVTPDSITTAHLTEQILKYLKPEITSVPQSQAVLGGQSATITATAEGKYLNYQWKKDGVDLVGETNATLVIEEVNATHDGNYTLVVSNDFGSVEGLIGSFDVDSTWATFGLVGWWRFDETSGTVATDSSSNENNGTLVSGPTWAQGKIGGALSFDGVDDHVDLGVANLGITNKVSVSYWFNPNTGNGVLLAQGSNYSGSEQGWVVHLGTNNNENTADRAISWLSSDNSDNYNGGAVVQTVTNSIALNQWQHVAVVKEGTLVKIHLDGVQIKEGQVAKAGITYVGYTISFGKVLDGTYYNAPFNGLLDDVRIFDRALSVAEVQSLYNLGQ